jgi:phage-related protein
MQDSVLEETGFGIYAIKGTNFELGETTVVIDVAKETIYEAGKDLQVDWQMFINAYIPKVLVEQI